MAAWCAPGRGGAAVTTCSRAGAKLTLVVAGRRRARRRLPPHRRRDGHARSRRPAHRRGPRRRRRSRRRDRSPPAYRPTTPTCRCAPWRVVGRTAAVHVDKQIPHGGGLGGGSADAAAILRWAGVDDPNVAVALGADVPFCLVGGRARVTGIGEIVDPLPPSNGSSRWSCRRCTSARPPSTAPGTSSAVRLRTAPTISSRRHSSSSRDSATWRDRIGELSGQFRGWPAAGRLVRRGQTRRRPRRIERRGRDGGRLPDGPVGRPGRLLAALVARAAKHLLVLLLPHPLAPLLDQRTHKVRPRYRGFRSVRRYRA